MKVTRMKYNSLEEVQYILRLSGWWKEEDKDLKESVYSNVVGDSTILYKPISKNGKHRYKKDIGLLIHSDLSFTLLMCSCVIECCGLNVTPSPVKFSMRNLYKTIKKNLN